MGGEEHLEAQLQVTCGARDDQFKPVQCLTFHQCVDLRWEGWKLI